MSLDTERSASANDDDEASTLETNREKLRRCLVCSEDFPSAWAGERVCKRCRSSSQWRQG